MIKKILKTLGIIILVLILFSTLVLFIINQDNIQTFLLNHPIFSGIILIITLCLFIFISGLIIKTVIDTIKEIWMDKNE